MHAVALACGELCVILMIFVFYYILGRGNYPRFLFCFSNAIVTAIASLCSMRECAVTAHAKPHDPRMDPFNFVQPWVAA